MSQTIEIQLQNYDDHMIMKKFSVATHKMYLRTLKRYLRFHKFKYGQRELSQVSAKQFILYRKKSGRSWPTINCDYSALRKYFRKVIQAEWTRKKMPRPRKENTLPRIISKQDVVKLIKLAGAYK